MRCYCHNEIEGRTVTLAVKVDWADGRGIHEKATTFCSFACIATWANDRSAQWDGPQPESEPEQPPVVDTTTGRAVR